MLENVCYVVRPARQALGEWQWVLEELIEPAARDVGFSCVLGEPMGEPGTLVDNLVSKLVHAELVIVDVSGCDDPRTFYQLGVRHARSNRTILITPDGDDIFSDFRPFYSLTYPSAAKLFPEFRRTLKEIMQKIRSQPDEPDNPVQRYLNGAGRLLEENRALRERMEELEREAHENHSLKEKVADLERTLTTLAGAPQVPRRDQRITFRPIP